MLNDCKFMGRLTADPELRYTQDGKPVTSFSLAVQRDHDREAVDFVDFVAWNKTAEFVSRNFSKGRMVLASGRLQFREWTDRDGQRRRSAEVIVDKAYFADSKPQNTERTPFNDSDLPFTENPVDDSDLPF